MYKIFLAVIFLSYSISGVVFAHGLGVTQQQIIGDYLIEFEYDGTGQVLAGELTTYAFEFLNKANNEPAAYERMFAKISKQGSSRPTFSGNLVPVELLGRKSARANITLGEAGPYTAELSFYTGSNELAKASFNFDVAVNPASAPPQESWMRKYAYGGVFAILVAVIGIQAVWLLKQRKRIARRQ